LYQDNVVVVTGLAYAFNPADNTDVVTFNMTKAGADFDCTEANVSPNALSIYFTQFNPTDNSFRFTPTAGRRSLEGNPDIGGTLTYLGAGVCESINPSLDNVDLSTLNGLFVVYGRDGSLTSDQESPELRFTRVAQNRFPFAAVLETATFTAAPYASAANNDGCEKCHTVPFLKHGYIYGQLNDDPATDFYTCKACHLDDGEGGHLEWQLVVDDPVLWASGAALTPAQEAKYAYTTRLMNDVHMSHIMEFPYPQSGSNCVVCHEGKLGVILADANFVVETCKSCHPQDGSDTYTGGMAGGIPYQELEGPEDATSTLALRTILPPPLHTGMALDGSVDCSSCHFAGNSFGAPVFSQIHTGFDTRIYYALGQAYRDAITVSIDNASFDPATNVLTWSFSAAGSAGGLDSANIVPTVLVGLYGFDTKDFLQGPHESEPTGLLNQPTTGSPRNLRALEYTVGSDSIEGRNSPYITVVGGDVTVDLSLPLWAGWIAADNVVRVEVAVIPELQNADGEVVALNAQSRTFDLAANAFDDAFYPAIVRVETGCNNCHEALGRTFHDPDRGGSIIVCRMCHITKAGGSHLEMQSRSIDSYAHAIHSFQAFDTGDIDFNDPVLALHYQDHVRFAFPTLGRTNCESCHNPNMFNVPDQTKSFPSVSSGSDDVSGRNIGTVPRYIMGPASRACGGCHRANSINNDDAGELGSFNSHTRTFGYLIETTTATDDDDILEIIFEIFSVL
jgi:OmcA/MtrC family decaheme c-type cytochrome